jgi:hypothetical protein
MPCRQPLLCLSLVLALVSPAAAQPLFRVISSTVTSAEGGLVNVLLVQAGDEHFSLRIPKGYGTQVRLESRSIVFTSESGASAITMQVTTNYPGTLPKMEELRDLVAKKHPGASLVQSSSCISDYGSGLCFDLFQPTQNNLTVRIRDAYFSYPEGSFEFTLTCNSADYDKSRLSFAWLLNSFRLQPEPAKKEP